MTDLRCRPAAVVTLLLLFCCLPSFTNAQTSCPSPPPLRGTANGNIFSEQQEMDLGDAIAGQFERNFRIVQDDQLNFYLDGIARRLLAQMPPTQLKFRIVLVDLPVVNAFTIPGGRIYVTRKLVAFTESEDELAGVLGHELGHALTHQPAAGVSVLFRRGLGVTQVGDRADIFAKYNQLIDNAARKQLHFDVGEIREDDLVADSYALYAMTRAGYSPKAMAEFWDRRAQTQGKTGSWLTDLFGGTTPNEQRLRQIRQFNPEMAAGCIAPHPQTAAAFQAWQQSVIEYASYAGRESLPGLVWKRQLAPPLESEVTNVKFSPDGKYLLAQDDFSIYVLSREPLKPIFRIPADEVEPASFTPNSQSVLIWTNALHVEKWSIDSQQRTEVHEVVTPQACIRAAVSPDGTLAGCVQMAPNGRVSFSVSVLDVATSSPLIVKENFFEMGLGSPLPMVFVSTLFSSGLPGLFHMGFSPDGHYFAASSAEQAMAWDLSTRSPVKLSTAVRDRMSGGFAFDRPDHIVGINLRDPAHSGGAQFPSGSADRDIGFYRQTFTAPARGNGVLVRPANDDAVALVDLKTATSLLNSKFSALDVYDTVYARPKEDGTIGIFDLDTRQAIASTALLSHWIGHLRTADISPDLKWFAASGLSRGAVWNLATGDRIFHVRGFGSCGFSSTGTLYAGFNSYLKEKRSIGILNPANHSTQSGVALDDDVGVAQIGTYLLHFRRDKNRWNGPVDLQLYDLTTASALWTKHFAHGAPGVLGSPSNAEMTFVMPLSSDEAKAEEKQNQALSAQTKDIASKDFAQLIQVLTVPDGKLQAEFAVDTGKNSFRIHEALPAGKWVVVADSLNRALIYSLDGKQTGSIFGSRPTVSSVTGAMALESQPGTLAVYDLATVAEREELVFGIPLAFYEFVDNGARLFAVTADETAYLVDLNQNQTKPIE
jgi:WD40 repeat protein